jgi:hypothetical protein
LKLQKAEEKAAAAKKSSEQDTEKAQAEEVAREKEVKSLRVLFFRRILRGCV